MSDGNPTSIRPGAAFRAAPAKYGSLAALPAARGGMSGCSFANVRERLQHAGLRPTRQRIAIGWLLFARGDRHVTAEKLFDEARAGKVHLSLATVYNTLHQFSEAGLLREIALYGSTVWYDTNTGPHYHFYVADKDELIDIPQDLVARLPLPAAPEGMEILGVDMIVRVRSSAPA